MEVYTDEIINDDDDYSDITTASTTTAEYKQVTEESKGKSKKGEKPAFWDKESNEKTAKKINEEDDYKWEDEVREKWIIIFYICFPYLFSIIVFYYYFLYLFSML